MISGGKTTMLNPGKEFIRNRIATESRNESRERRHQEVLPDVSLQPDERAGVDSISSTTQGFGLNRRARVKNMVRRKLAQHALLYVIARAVWRTARFFWRLPAFPWRVRAYLRRTGSVSGLVTSLHEKIDARAQVDAEIQAVSDQRWQMLLELLTGLHQRTDTIQGMTVGVDNMIAHNNRIIESLNQKCDALTHSMQEWSRDASTMIASLNMKSDALAHSMQEW